MQPWVAHVAGREEMQSERQPALSRMSDLTSVD